MNYKLSVLLPSAHEEKRNRFLQNLKETVSDINSIEIVICLDGYEETKRIGNTVLTYSPPSKYRSTFFEKCYRESTGRFVLMANDDILFKTKNWDKMIPFDSYPDDLVLFYFKDNQFNHMFSCHPVWSRKIMNTFPELLDPLYNITKCDNTIWDVHPPHRRIYIPEIEIEHIQTPYGSEWLPQYEEDNKTYMENVYYRTQARNFILKELGLLHIKVMVGVVTGENARRADFYDHFNQIDKPTNSISIAVHGQSIAHNRNQVVEQALIHGCTHVLFIDDDVICNPDIIFKLLEHKKYIVTGLQLRRNFPHTPLIFKDWIEKEKMFSYYHLSQLNGERLVPIKAAGLGAVLIDTEVFKRMEKPWFRFGEFKLDQMSEDTGFFKRANDLGIESYCDTNCPVGHVSSIVVRPIKKGDNWIVDYDSGGTGSIGFVPREG